MGHRATLPARSPARATVAGSAVAAAAAMLLLGTAPADPPVDAGRAVGEGARGDATRPAPESDGGDGTAPGSAAARRAADPYRWFDPLIELRTVIADGFVDEADALRMQRAALEAMAASLGDPNSAYLAPETERSLLDRMTGSFVGIGVELSMPGDRPVVMAPIDDSPAADAGIVSGDVILAVDGRDTSGMDAAALETLLPGAPGSRVVLALRSPDGRERTVALTRARIETVGVKGVSREGARWDHVLDPDRRIGYLRIAAFNDRTLADLDAGLRAMAERGLSGIVLDLRDNGGGSLESAIGAADRFLRSGAIVSIRGRGRTQGRTWDATESPDDVGVPMVVLVNEGSASASEVLAGALRCNGRAVLVGVRSFGKGSVQEIRPLADGGAIKMTTARYFLPSGESVSREPGSTRWGVEPQTGFRVAMTGDEMRAAAALRRSRERGAAPRGGGTATDGGAATAVGDAPGAVPAVNWSSPRSIREDARDPQLAAALQTLQGYLDAGEWAAVGDLSGEVGAGNDQLLASLERRRALQAELRSEDDRISSLRTQGAGVDDPMLSEHAPLIDGEVEVRDREGRVVGRWVVKDPAALRDALRSAAVPAPEYTPATEPEGK